MADLEIWEEMLPTSLKGEARAFHKAIMDKAGAQLRYKLPGGMSDKKRKTDKEAQQESAVAEAMAMFSWPLLGKQPEKETRPGRFPESRTS